MKMNPDDQRDQSVEMMYRIRGIENPCPACGGSGVKVYASTSTWRGGMGGSVCTRDVCDKCWGSGDKDRTWVNLRSLEAKTNERIAREAVSLLTNAAGAPYSVCREAVLELVGELEKLAGGRKVRPDFFYELCTCLVNTIKKGLPDE
jgi:hypothetical protein